LLVYNLGSGGLAPAGYYFNAGTPAAPVWTRFATGGDEWHVTGNSGTTPASNFIGTIDAVDWVIRTSNTERVRVLSSGNVGIGTTAPVQRLHVAGNEMVDGDIYIRSNFGASGLLGTIHHGPTGLIGQANGLNFGTGDGLWIEGSNDWESGGMFFNGNIAVLWSTGDNDLFRIYDEDMFPAGAPRVVVNGAGYVGIGHATPPYKLTVQDGSIGGNYALTPNYSSWATYGTGDGGAAVYNDNNAYRTLMIVGNNSAGGNRRVGIWDHLTVNGNISITGNNTQINGVNYYWPGAQGGANTSLINDGAGNLFWGSATAGQQFATVYSTGQIYCPPNNTYYAIPGLTQTINVPASGTYDMYIFTDGGAYLNSGGSNVGEQLEISIWVDGAANRYITQIIDNTSNYTYCIRNWSTSLYMNGMTPGNHTVAVQARNRGVTYGLYVADANAVGNYLRSSLTVGLIKR
jgi:hypothetical protein